MVAQPQQAQEPDNVVSFVSSAKTSDVMNMLIQLRLDITKSQTRTDTLLENIVQRQETMEQKIDTIAGGASQTAATLSVMQQRVGEHDKQLIDHETRLRDKTERMKELDVIRSELKELREDIAGLVVATTQSNTTRAEDDKKLDDRIRELEKFKWWLVGAGISGSFLGGAFADQIMGMLFR